MHLRYRYRLYPNRPQRQALARAFGCARVVYNDAVAARRDAYRGGGQYPSSTLLQRRLITEAKHTPERAFLAEVSNIVLQQAVRDCDAAYRRFFEAVKAQGQPFVGHPRFRSRKENRQAIRLHTGGFSIRANGKLRLARIGDVPVRWSRDLPSTPSSVTVIRDAAGRYFASFVVEAGDETAPPAVNADGTEREIALDLGLNHFAVDQHGNGIANPRCLRRAERRLRKAQKAVSRKQRGSNNRAKARRRLARCHAKVADTRADWLHQQTTRLVRENQAIYVEDLAVRGLARTRLAKSVQDAAWGQFQRLLEEKARRQGRTVIAVSRFEPTSQVCSRCGRKDGPKALAIRTWTCAGCGATHERDTNAARNILALGRRERLNACGADVRPPVVAVGGEAGTHQPARA
ncbi:RNA-guided endonuclease InsQ/TnpB family protein [Halorhodospira halophila]|uniref:RNA-guided endonuclease InsQ/TnpB family protein n=1 Tax=Halorhodospira halophila TaxID=1053 RepID=UPI00191323BB|nr:RNA-guided endonuclease TnpB family protein [Halorhodospira halophila]MBK5935523.1 transposase [Halorhodospira halophila]